MSRYVHYAHLRFVPLVKAGDWVRRGDVIGFIGNEGKSSGAHLHVEGTKSKPVSWTVYPTGWSKLRVQQTYFDITPYLRDGIPADFTYKGYGFLQWTGSSFHPGVDVNSPNDLGKPVFSIFNGRVVHAQGISGVKWVLGRLVPSYFNKGWGNHVWVETDEINPGIKIG